MKRVALYSRSSRSRASAAPVPASSSSPYPGPEPPRADDGAASAPAPRWPRTRRFVARHERLLLVASAALFTLALLIAYTAGKPAARQLTQKDIDAAVIHTLQNKVLPSAETRAFATVGPSIVRVRQLGKRDGADTEVKGIGTGVVIVDKGIILTNLHVVAGAERVQVQFANGMESDAQVISLQPENDLAVLQAKNIPDDLVSATLRSTADLALGDKVIAVGFPFGIGPSVSSGVVSGLRRQYQSPEGENVLSNLIQFDAAANPGNSGGPLVTMDGAVVGIVTAILNPNAQGVFIGIGFAVPIENAAATIGTPPF